MHVLLTRNLNPGKFYTASGLEDLVKPLPPGDASTVHTRILGVAQNILDAPDDMSANGPRQCAIITSA